MKNIKKGFSFLKSLIRKRFNIFVFIFFTSIIFILFKKLFSNYFIADEWVVFTYFLPFTRTSHGLLSAISATVLDNGALSSGEHVTPIASTIYFLNTYFFGLSYEPYAFMSLLLHAVNSFLVYFFIKVLLSNSKNTIKNIYGIMGGFFFAIAPNPVHTVTGAAPFYGENILSVTLVLLSIISLKLAYIKENKKYVYLSLLCFFLALFSKETAGYLFLLLPFMVILEKRVFPLKFLGKLFIICVITYGIFRFVLPNINQGVGPLVDKLIGSYISSSLPSWQQTTQQQSPQDTGTIVSRDLSIHKNLPAEVMFRIVTFPIKMTGTLFLPREITLAIVKFITPIVYPLSTFGVSAEQSSAVLGFIYGPGNAFVIYLVSISILISCAVLVVQYLRKRKIQEAQAITTAIGIIVFSSLPLVTIIFYFPRWGYDYYFDSRYYYHPTVGAAIIFPFLLFGLAKFISSLLRIRKVSFMAAALFIGWLVFDLNSFNYNFNAVVNRYGSDSRELVKQLKEYLHALPKNVVIYAETDGLSAYGPSLPFQTSVPQALTVVYYDKSPLPDSFFEKPLFDGKGEGYQYSEGRGFGYYTSKKNLGDALNSGKFKTSDIYAFYYKAEDVRVLDITPKVRDEMDIYLSEAKENSDWKKFIPPSTNLSFSIPPLTEINEEIEDDPQSTAKSFTIASPNFIAEMTIYNIAPSFAVNDYLQIASNGKLDIVNSKKVSYDRFHYNDAFVFDEDTTRKYLIQLGDKLIILEVQNTNQYSLLPIEKMLGSIEVVKPL